MSRSRRRTKIIPNAMCKSEARDKKIWHRRFRRLNRVRVNCSQEPVPINQVSDTWNMSKDGKHYWEDADDKAMRK